MPHCHTIDNIGSLYSTAIVGHNYKLCILAQLFQHFTSFLYLVIAISLLLAISALSVYGSKKEPTVDVLYGTWINEEYSKIVDQWAKRVYKSDGTIDKYRNHDDTEISGTDLFAVQKIWSEKDGAIYFNVIETYTDSKTEVYFLYKLSADGKTLEMNY